MKPVLFPRSALEELRAVVEGVPCEVARRHSEEVDRDGRWPAETMAALASAGLMGLHVPTAHGGYGLGLEALVIACEALGRACPSAGLCFGMHSVGTAVIAAKATDEQRKAYLEPIAAGEHVTTLALSERGTGSHFYLPATQVRREGDGFVIDGEKRFVTNGAHANSCVVSTAAPDTASDAGAFSCFIVDAGAPGTSWGAPWSGFGMRGNDSRTLHLDGVRVPEQNLLGDVGDQVWYAFEIITPYFLMAMSGAYLGLAQGALDAAKEHLVARRHDHSGEALADVPLLQHRFATLWMEVESARRLLLHAAQRGDAGAPDALPAILGSKARVADVAIMVANDAMTLCGGIAYEANSRGSRLLRDARAAAVMSPTTDILKQWCGRALLDRPLL